MVRIMVRIETAVDADIAAACCGSPAKFRAIETVIEGKEVVAAHVWEHWKTTGETGNLLDKLSRAFYYSE